MKYPKLVKLFALSTPISADVTVEGIDEDGAPVTGVTYSGLCNYQDNARRIVTNDKVETDLTGTAYFDGDIAPALSVISGGTAVVHGAERIIVKGEKARNPDGTVNFTRLDLK